MGYDDRRDINVLQGKIFTAIDKTDKELMFTCKDGEQYRMYHDSDCCEVVYLEDIVGDLADLIDTPILSAEVTTNSEKDPADVLINPEYRESFTWTFYHFRTHKGTVTLRWYGSSNGYYSEGVDLEIIEGKEDETTIR